jgi:hypothetical protein
MRCAREGAISLNLVNGAQMSDQGTVNTADLDAESQSAAWFALVDAGKGDASWSSAGALFRDALEPATWSTQLHAARDPLGPVTSRALAVEQRTPQLPGMLEGDFIVRQYHSVYDGTKAVTETLTLQLEADGVWRVVGYFIR